MAGANHFQFSVLSPASNVVQIWKSSDLHTWTSVGFMTNTTGTNIFTDTNAVGKKLYYRAQE